MSGSDDGARRLESEVRELVRLRGVDPVGQPEDFRRLVAEAVVDYEERALAGRLLPLPDPELAAKAVTDAVAGLGPLQPYLEDPQVEDIWINGPSSGL